MTSLSATAHKKTLENSVFNRITCQELNASKKTVFRNSKMNFVVNHVTYS